jgi:Fe-Mn family superoxide dismutase
MPMIWHLSWISRINSNRTFGGAERFREQFSSAALSLQGAGWAALSWEPIGSSLVVEQIYDHQGNTGNGTIPLLVLDMWEHVYYLQHRANKATWIESFWEMVDWTDVEKRFDNVAHLDRLL